MGFAGYRPNAIRQLRCLHTSAKRIIPSCRRPYRSHITQWYSKHTNAIMVIEHNSLYTITKHLSVTRLSLGGRWLFNLFVICMWYGVPREVITCFTAVKMRLSEIKRRWVVIRQIQLLGCPVGIAVIVGYSFNYVCEKEIACSIPWTVSNGITLYAVIPK